MLENKCILLAYQHPALFLCYSSDWMPGSVQGERIRPQGIRNAGTCPGAEKLQQSLGTSTGVAHSTHSVPKTILFLSSSLYNLEEKLLRCKYITIIFLISEVTSRHCESFQMMRRILLASGEKSPDSEQPTSKMPFV